MTLLLLSLLACREPAIIVIPGVTASLEVVVTNPTSCPVCDAFTDVDTLRLDVTVGDEVIASDSFAYPDEAVTLPDLTDFAVVRVTLLGLADGRVISAGRTPEIVISDAAALSVPLVFLPANRALPLATPMIEDRSRHAAIPRRDGSVLFIGGLDPMRQRATAATEVYDPALGTFTEFEPFPNSGAAGFVTAPLPNGATLLTGGFAVIGDADVPVDGATIFDDTSGAWVESGAMSNGRADHCVAMFVERQGIVLGGPSEFAEYLKPDDETGVWAFSSLEMRDFESADVTDCAVLADGKVFVQGVDGPSTGVWDGGNAELDPAAAFEAVSAGAAGDLRHVSGPTLFPLADGGIAVVGGADVTTGEVYADARLFAPGTMRFDEQEGFAAPRFDAQSAPWISGDWHAVGCGWADAERAEDEPSVELYDPVAGVASPPFELDRARPGCSLTVLTDGSILVAGGFALGSTSGDDAALIVPYIDPAFGS